MLGIYCIINTKNGKRYVGQSVDVGRRIREHLSELKSNTHPNKDLQEDFNKFSHYFKISYLELNIPQSKLSAREKY
jgi:group I intron endonuclease